MTHRVLVSRPFEYRAGEPFRPYEGDSRHALRLMLERYAAHGWTPVVATELEFYLIDDADETLQPPPSPRPPSSWPRRPPGSRRSSTGRTSPAGT